MVAMIVIGVPLQLAHRADAVAMVDRTFEPQRSKSRRVIPRRRRQQAVCEVDADHLLDVRISRQQMCRRGEHGKIAELSASVTELKNCSIISGGNSTGHQSGETRRQARESGAMRRWPSFRRRGSAPVRTASASARFLS